MKSWLWKLGSAMLVGAAHGAVAGGGIGVIHRGEDARTAVVSALWGLVAVALTSGCVFIAAFPPPNPFETKPPFPVNPPPSLNKNQP